MSFKFIQNMLNNYSTAYIQYKGRNMNKFKVGDRIKAYHHNITHVGIVDAITENGLLVLQDKLGVKTYAHAKQCRKLKPKKRKATKTIERWVNVYPDGSSGGGHLTREGADSSASSTRITCVKLTGTYEVEE